MDVDAREEYDALLRKGEEVKRAKPPRTYDAFVETHPKLGAAWDLVREAEEAGPLDEKARRVVKLAVAVGALREGAVHSAVRKARAADVDPATIDQVMALAASTIGFPSAVAVFSWIRDEMGRKKR